jgi:ElaA protein
MLQLHWHNFSDLSLHQLYSVLKLRSEVFVVEQKCHYLDPDGEDIFSYHLLGSEVDELVTYCRLFPPKHNENKLVFGRVVTAKSSRNKGYGKQLIEELLLFCSKHYPGIPIKCSAQYYLIKFYESFGFETHGNVYDDVGVPHIEMLKLTT